MPENITRTSIHKICYFSIKKIYGHCLSLSLLPPNETMRITIDLSTNNIIDDSNDRLYREMLSLEIRRTKREIVIFLIICKSSIPNESK